MVGEGPREVRSRARLVQEIGGGSKKANKVKASEEALGQGVPIQSKRTEWERAEEKSGLEGGLGVPLIRRGHTVRKSRGQGETGQFKADRTRKRATRHSNF